MMTRDEALKYFGINNEEELEELVLEHGLLAEVDVNGRILVVDLEGASEALHTRFERKHGLRPDDPKVVEEAKKRIAKREHEKKQRLRQGMVPLGERVQKRRKERGLKPL